MLSLANDEQWNRNGFSCAISFACFCVLMSIWCAMILPPRNRRSHVVPRLRFVKLFWRAENLSQRRPTSIIFAASWRCIKKNFYSHIHLSNKISSKACCSLTVLNLLLNGTTGKSRERNIISLGKRNPPVRDSQHSDNSIIPVFGRIGFRATVSTETPSVSLRYCPTSSQRNTTTRRTNTPQTDATRVYRINTNNITRYLEFHARNRVTLRGLFPVTTAD